MRTWLGVAVGILGVALAAGRAQALTFGVGCADACGKEVIVLGATAQCTMETGNDPEDGFSLVVQKGTVFVTHMDGIETVDIPGTPADVPPPPDAMHTGFLDLPVTISTHPGDDLLPNGVIELRFIGTMVATFPEGNSTSFSESWGDNLHVIAAPTCTATTTTLPVTVTTRTVTTTSATTSTLGGVARHPCNPHASPNSRWCR